MLLHNNVYRPKKPISFGDESKFLPQFEETTERGKKGPQLLR